MASLATDLPLELRAFDAVLARATEESPGGANILVVVAHPDDETIGLGGQLARLGQATIVHVTDGAPRRPGAAQERGFPGPDTYAAARRRELAAAMAEAGMAATSLVALGIPDQDAPNHIADIAYAIHEVMLRPPVRRPGRPFRYVCTHPFEGGHPDHDATALAVWAACDFISQDRNAPPMIIEMASYHLGEHGAVFQRFAEEGPELVLELDEADFARKGRMLDAHHSQRDRLANFRSRQERFRLPRCNWLTPPNGGRLLYETMPLGWTWTAWREAARTALAELRFDVPA